MKADSLIFLCICFFLHQAFQGNAVKVKYHCLRSNNPLRFTDPLPKRFKTTLFVGFYWYQKVNGSDLLLWNMDMNGNIFRSVKRWNTYQFWGIELQDPKLTDAGKYRAVYTSAAAQRDSIFYFDVIMIEPPILKSKRLDVSRKVNNQTGEVTLTCGTIASLGNPPVDVILQIPNGTIIKNSTYENGSYITVLSKDPGKGTFTCKLNDSMTKSCIPQSDLPLWEDNFMHKVARGIGQPAAEFNIILVVGIICLVLLIITGIIVVVTLIKRKKNQGLVYNTKDEEIKADNRQEEELSHPLVIRDDANAYDTPNAHPQFYNRQGKPTSPGGHMASPYMVSGLKLPQGETGEVKLPPKKNKKPPVAATESIESVGKDSGNGKTGGRYTKRGEAKGASGGGKGEGDGKEPPTPKKRSIFLTESNEALDKIAEAVAGGKGSGVDGGRAGESRV